MKLINKENALADSPKTTSDWNNKPEEYRLNKIKTLLSGNQKYNIFEVIKAPQNGQIVLKIEKSIEANARGVFLLELEEFLKKEIDRGITVWLELVGDKSKLRNLRGISLKSI